MEMKVSHKLAKRQIVEENNERRNLQNPLTEYHSWIKSYSSAHRGILSSDDRLWISNNVLKDSLEDLSFKIPFRFLFIVQNDHPAPTAHDTPKAYVLS